jgi:hypothetical protein
LESEAGHGRTFQHFVLFRDAKDERRADSTQRCWGSEVVATRRREGLRTRFDALVLRFKERGSFGTTVAVREPGLDSLQAKRKKGGPAKDPEVLERFRFRGTARQIVVVKESDP